MRRVLLATGLGVLALALVAAAIVGWQYRRLVAWAATPHAVEKPAVVEVAGGAGPRTVADLLAAAGAVDDRELFYRHVRWIRRVPGRLKAGEYLFEPSAPQTPDQIVNRLLKGEILEVKVTVPEGLRLDEQAPLFEAAGLGDAAEYVRLARDPAFARSLGVEARSLEGYLFPDTYRVPHRAGPRDVLRLQVERFRRAWAAALPRRDPAVTLDMHQAVTLASIVEKETGRPEERPRISCVFHNRLAKGMRLQTDPTVIYDVLMRSGAFSGNLRRVDLETPGPYNTYLRTGLPPGPIANPGEAALVAALAPATCPDLFFVSRNDGSHVFCPDFACHEAAVRKWQVEFFRRKRQQR